MSLPTFIFLITPHYLLGFKRNKLIKLFYIKEIVNWDNENAFLEGSSTPFGKVLHIYISELLLYLFLRDMGF